MKRKWQLLIGLALTLVVTSGLYAFTYTSATATVDVTAAGAIATSASSTGQPDWNSLIPVPSDWSYRKKITIDHTKVEANLTNFPVLISITDTDLRDYAQGDGDDIKFTTSDGTTQLDHEIENFDGGTGELVAWVEVLSLSSSTDTDIYMYYGNATCASQENVEGTWDTNFKMVQHLKDDPDTSHTTDSTSNDNDGTKKGANDPIETGGKIDRAQDFSSDHISCGDLGIGDNYTAECWIKADTLTGTGDYDTYGFTVMASAVSGQGYPLWLAVRGTEVRLWAYETTPGTGGWRETTGAGLNTTGDFHIVATAIRSSTTKVYVNGVERLSFTNDGEVSWTNIFTIGDLRPDRAIYFDGIIDEVRISDIARDADWIETSYNNQSTPSTFYSLGGHEDAPTPRLLGEVPTGDLFDITPQTDYTGDLAMKVYLTNVGDLSKAYDYLNMKLYLAGSVEAGETPDYQLLTLQNGEASFNIQDLIPTSGSWLQTSQSDFLGGTLNQVDATSLGDVILDTFSDWVTDTFDDETKIASKPNLVVSDSEVRLIAGGTPGDETFRPNAVGDDTNISSQYPDSGSHWDKVDDVTADDYSTYVYTNSTSYLRDLFNISDHSTGIGAIDSVTAHFSFAKASAVGDVAMYQDTNNTQTSPSPVGTWEGVEFNNPNREDSATYEQQANDIDVMLKETGRYLIIYAVRATSTSSARHIIRTRVTLAGGVVEGGYGYGYSRDNNNDELYATGCVVVNNTTADQLLRIEWENEGVAGSDVLSESKSSFSIIKLPDDVAYGRYTDDTDTSADGGTTWNDIPWSDIEEETDTAVIEKQTGDTAIRLKSVARYLVTYSVTYAQSSSTRTQRIARATLGGTPIEQSFSYIYLRNDVTEPCTLVSCFIIDNTVADQDLVIQVQRGDADVDGTVARVIDSSGLDIVELPASAETVITHDNTGGQDVSTTQTLNWASSEDQRDAAAFTLPAVTTIEVEQDDDYLFLGNGLIDDTTHTSSTRLTSASDWFIGGVEHDGGGHGTYIRHDQGSADTWNGSFNAFAVLPSLNANDQITLRSTLEGDAGGTDNTVANQCGFSALRIGSLAPGSAYARAAVKTSGSVYTGSEESTASETFTAESYIWTDNPDTGSAWTWDEIDALQIGVELKADNTTINAACTQVYIVVDYTAYSSPGTLTSINLLSAETVGSIDSFDYDSLAIPSGTGLKVQFSQDNTNWYDSSGTPDGWNTLSQGTHNIDISGLGWSGSNFYYKMEFTSDGSDTPVLDEITANFSTYYASGDLTSSAYDTGYDLAWDWETISFTIDEPSATNIQFQIRTAATEGGLSSATWYGPTGTGDYYTTSGTSINSVHDGDRWIQYKAYFTGPGDDTPTLSDNTITYSAAAIYYTIEVTGGAYSLVSTDTSTWESGWTVIPELYCHITQR